MIARHKSIVGIPWVHGIGYVGEALRADIKGFAKPLPRAGRPLKRR